MHLSLSLSLLFVNNILYPSWTPCEQDVFSCIGKNRFIQAKRTSFFVNKNVKDERKSNRLSFFMYNVTLCFYRYVRQYKITTQYRFVTSDCSNVTNRRIKKKCYKHRIELNIQIEATT
jgi:hypothetical protein